MTCSIRLGGSILRQNILTLIALACLAVPFSLVPTASASCNEQRTEVVGVDTYSTGIYTREKTDEYGGCRYDSTYNTWEQNCTTTVLEPSQTPSSVTIPEVRVLGEVIVPRTTILLPWVSLPGAYAPSRPADSECGVSDTDYGVYETWYPNAAYSTYLGTDGCNPGPDGYNSGIIGWGWLVGMYVCPALP